MNKEITTLEELRRMDGHKITCEINGTKIEDCLVSIDYGASEEYTNRVFLLQNNEDGVRCRDTKGYKYSWVANLFSFKSLSNIYPLVEEGEEATSMSPKYYYKDSPSKPEWFDGRPVLVFYSDESEEDAVKEGYIGWLVGIEGKRKYPFRVLMRDGLIGDGTEEEQLVCNNPFYFSYVVPVPTKEEELKALREQREELDKRITGLIKSGGYLK